MSLFPNTRRINVGMLFKVIGWLLLIEAAFMALPLGVSLWYGEDDWFAFLVAAGVTMVSGLLMTTFIRPADTSMGKREGFLLTALVWVVFSIFGLIPFVLCRTPLSAVNGFFETMSGFTTTGASVYTDIDSLSRGINLWRCLTQWIGGMGIILFTLAVLPMLNSSGGIQMFNAEVTGITHEKLRPRISQTAKSLWGIYFGLSALAGLAFWAGPMDLFESICHALTTVSTGGFSTRTASLGAWNSDYIMAVATVFMFLGGVNFALIYRGINGDFRALRTNNTFMVYLSVIASSYLAFVAAILLNGQFTSWRSVTIEPLFQVVTAITSTGLTVDSISDWGSFAMLLLCVIMFFGGCAGSTSGGAKIDRFIFLVKNSHNELYRSVHPNSVRSVRFNGNMVAPEVVEKVIAFLCMYVMVIVTGAIILSAIGMPAVDAMFNSFSCVSNVGIMADSTNTGIASLAPAGKFTMCLLMLTGRLELFTVLILFTPSFWLK